MRPTTDLEGVRSFLDADPLGTTMVWERAFHMEGPREVYACGEPPAAVLAVVRPPWAEGEAGVGMHAADPAAARELMDAWPKGPVFAHLTEEWMLPLLEARAESVDAEAVWLFRLQPAAFVDREGPGVRPLGPEWAGNVARAWSGPEWDATGYVRSRIDAGPAYAVFSDGEPVAWTLTHAETPRASVLGFLHVLEPYRRKGFAQSVTSAIVKDVLGRGKVPVLHVATDNVASLELSARMGFSKVKRQVFAEGVMR